MKISRESLETTIQTKGGVYQGTRFPWRVWLLQGELVRVPAKDTLDENDLRVIQARLASIEISLKKGEK